MNKSKEFDKKFVVYAIAHVNDDHRLAMVKILRGLCDAYWVTDAKLLDYDHEKMVIMGSGKSQNRSFELSFDTPLKNAKEFRQALISMLRKAEQKLPSRNK